MLFRWRKVWKVSTKEERKHEEAMLAQARSGDRQAQAGAAQQTKKWRWVNKERMPGWGEETSSNWARKSSQKHKEQGLGTHTHPQRLPSPTSFLPSESKHAINKRAGHAHGG